MEGGSWHCRGGSDQDDLQEKEIQQGKMVVRGCLKNSSVKKWKAKEKGKTHPLECRVPKNSKER